VPMLVLAMARHEPLEEHGIGRSPSHRQIILELPDADATAIIDKILDRPTSPCAPIAQAAEGNPPYVEQITAMPSRPEARRDGDGCHDPASGEVAIPPTIQASCSPPRRAQASAQSSSPLRSSASSRATRCSRRGGPAPSPAAHRSKQLADGHGMTRRCTPGHQSSRTAYGGLPKRVRCGPRAVLQWATG
jgi:hypothetical protein